MNFHVVTLFPEVVDAYAQASILGRAQKEGKLKVKTYQLRDYVSNKWGKVDERPYGGGPGMVLQAEPFVKAVGRIEKNIAGASITKTKKVQKRGLIYQSAGKPKHTTKVVVFGAGGKRFTNTMAQQWAKRYSHIILLAGRYEGIDARVKRILKAEEISIGPYVLTGGEVPALAVIDATARHIPGVLGKIESLEEGRVASHDVYTRPEVFEYQGKKYRVPKVLLSGHHANIDIQRARKRSS